MPHLDDPMLNEILVDNFNKLTEGRWGKKFLAGMYPREFETCLWDIEHRGPEPRFWRYTKHAACHWLVNFNLRLAMLAEPRQKWRILESEKHSTVWDGDETLFDFNFLAMNIPADECFGLAAHDVHLSPGQFAFVAIADHYIFLSEGSIS